MADQVGAPGITTIANEAHQLVPTGDKLLCVRIRDQRVLSLQPPDGRQEYRDPGTNGPFEQCELSGSSLVWDYTWDLGAGPVRYIFSVAWKAGVDEH